MAPASPWIDRRPIRLRLLPLVVLIAVALAARWAAIGDPVVHSDEQFYLTVARAWLGGALPYVDIWDRKPIGLFLLYAPAAAWRDPAAGVIAYQLTALAAAVATALLIAAIARRAGWGRGALPAAILYLLWLDLADGQGGQAPVFYDALMAAAALLAMAARRRRTGLAAMALVGLAMQVKYAVVFEGAWFGSWLLWRDRAAHGVAGRIGHAAALVAVAALPTLVAWGSYAAIGEGGAWAFANLRSILLRGAAPVAEQLGNLATCAAILAGPVAMALAGWRRVPAGGHAVEPRRFVQGWLASALAGFLAFGTWFDHYTLPVLVPAMTGAAAWLGTTRWRWPVAIAAALAGQAALLAARAERGTPAQFAALAAAVGRGPGCLYVYAGPSMLYPATGRCRATRFAYPSHLTRVRESRAIGTDPPGEVDRLFARRPAVVVMGRPFRGEAPAIRALALRLLAADGYRLATTRPLGRDRLAIYRRR